MTGDIDKDATRDANRDMLVEPPAHELAVDFAFLAVQTFDDLDLQKEVLSLFVAQARRLTPTLPGLDGQAQNDAAHLLKGSARGIGAWSTAAAAEAYEAAPPAERPAAFALLAAAVTEADTAIGAWLAGPAGAQATI